MDAGRKRKRTLTVFGDIYVIGNKYVNNSDMSFIPTIFIYLRLCC